MVDKSTPNILNCNASASFWMSWFDSLIRVGRGIHSHNAIAFMEYKDEYPYTINSISPFTATGFEGTWWFPQHYGEKIYIGAVLNWIIQI